MPDSQSEQSAEALVKKEAPELWHHLPKQQRPKLVAFVEKFTLTQTSHYSGPIPSPHDLEEFARIIPNGAERFMKLAEDQASHRMSLENESVKSQLRQSERGQWMALAIVLLLIALATVLAFAGHKEVACTIFGVTIVGIASVFITGKLIGKRNLDKKRPN